MPITYETLMDFVAKNGDVRIFPTNGVRILPTGVVDTHDLIEQAQQFGYKSRLYSRAEFQEIMSSAQTKR